MLSQDLPQLPARLVAYAAIGREILPHAEHEDAHNIWILDTSTDRWVLQVNRESGDDASWRYRREPSITLPWADAVVTIDGVPVLNPAAQLLWKSTAPAPKDDADLGAVLPRLSVADRDWLHGSIVRAHPSSPWLAAGLLDRRPNDG